MLLFLLVAVATISPGDGLTEAKHAIDVGRLDQARTMISAVIASGQTGEPVDRILADLAFVSGNSAEALARYGALLARHPEDAAFLERAAISAAKLGDGQQAQSLARRATRASAPSWRAWNVLGVTADRRGDFTAADEAYDRALALSPDQPELLNNVGWSHLMRGDWSGAIPLLTRAKQIQPGLSRAANNLELAAAALSESLPRRKTGESNSAWAARLNDAGIAAQIRGDRSKAIAAFAQAIEVRDIWYERAANNLRSAETQP